MSFFLHLYPEINPYHSQMLDVGDGHELYVEESGNPDGIPVLFLHGGPGAGCETWHRQLFDPLHYRIVLFDQRGCGKSKPHAELANNTTWDLVADIERIRDALGVERWLLFGGSWGSTLALAHAQTHPEHVRGLILRGIFLCRRHEIEWFYQQGTSRLFPEYWQDFIAPIPPDKRDSMLEAYHEILTGDDEIHRLAAAKAWSIWEGRTATMHTNDDIVSHFGNAHTALSMARIECNYFINDAYLEADQLLNNMERIAHLPGTIVHGRYDAICPVENAWQLHQCWPGSRLEIVPDAGHSAAEKSITAALVAATDRFISEQ